MLVENRADLCIEHPDAAPMPGPVPKDTLISHYASAPTSIVVAGHYCLAEDMQALSHDGEEEESSFAFGVHLVEATLAAGHASRLVLWINDIGIAPTARSAIKKDYRLPRNYQAILERTSLPPDRLVICFESTMRNKASTLLRKVFKKTPEKFVKLRSDSSDLLRCISAGANACELEQDGQMAYTIDGPEGERLVVKDGPNPKCNLILAALFQDILRKFAPAIQINVFNELYAPRIALGIHVFRALFDGRTQIANVFCDGTEYLAQDPRAPHSRSLPHCGHEHHLPSTQFYKETTQ